MEHIDISILVGLNPEHVAPLRSTTLNIAIELSNCLMLPMN
ncbi:3021_t:CDS:1, partial [Ambispora gerdemannii]